MMEAGANGILSLESLLVGYLKGRKQRCLLPPLDISVKHGELVALIGQNGIGKSTLLRTITGLHPALGGNVTILGRSLSGYSRYELARSIAYISTEPVRVNNMKVLDLVKLGRYPHTSWTGRLGANDVALVSEAIEKTGLHALTARYINELSDGERQRAMIARVLAQDAEILIMDEPTAFLDIRSRYEIIHLLHDLSRNRGKTIIFSTHDMLTALGESDRIWLAFKDRFIEGAPEDLVLDGSFGKLFDDSGVRFNPSDASITYRQQASGKVRIDVPGIEGYWAGKAANRAGFAISDSDADIVIEVSSANNKLIWLVRKREESFSFASLYDLVAWLGSKGRDG